MADIPSIWLAEADQLDALRPGFEAMYAHFSDCTGRSLLALDGFDRWLQGYARARGTSRAIFAAGEPAAPAGFIEGVMLLPPSWYEPRRIGHVAHLWVEASVRRQGLAGALADRLDLWFFDRKIRVGTIDVVSGNDGAAAFWATRGFQPEFWRMTRDLEGMERTRNE